MGRVNKYLSEAGFCSRREADKLIEQGRVTVNGRVASMGDHVAEGDSVEVDGERLRGACRRRIYLAFNKPTGITCTTDPSDPDNIVDFIGHRERIFNIGRLDKDSEGLIFLTNDGDIVNKILRAGNNHQKEYIVAVDKPIAGDFLHRMASGVRILGTLTQPCEVRQIGPARFRIILTQGLNRQIRRMCEALGYRVVALRRIRIMNITLDGIEVGKWRYFSEGEIAAINRLIADSSGTEEASDMAVARTVKKKPFSAKGPAKHSGKSISPAGGRAKPAGRGAGKAVAGRSGNKAVAGRAGGGKPAAGSSGRSSKRGSSKPPRR